jgi:hypothetical protein
MAEPHKRQTVASASQPAKQHHHLALSSFLPKVGKEQLTQLRRDQSVYPTLFWSHLKSQSYASVLRDDSTSTTTKAEAFVDGKHGDDPPPCSNGEQSQQLRGAWCCHDNIPPVVNSICDRCAPAFTLCSFHQKAQKKRLTLGHHLLHGNSTKQVLAFFYSNGVCIQLGRVSTMPKKTEHNVFGAGYGKQQQRGEEKVLFLFLLLFFFSF